MNTKNNDWKKGCQLFLIFVVGSIYFSEISAQGLPHSSYQSYAGSDSGSSTVGPFNYYGKVPVLSAFSFEFIRDDHHLSGIGIETHSAANLITHSYRDQDSNDFYQYSYSLALINPSDILRQARIYGSCYKYPCTYLLPPPPQPDAVLVIKSFELEFFNFDHHIDEVAVFENNGHIVFRLNDKNKDDYFSYRLTYVYLPRSLFIEVSEYSGRDKGGVSGPFSIRRGIPVLRGFHFNFAKVRKWTWKGWRWRETDHQIRAIQAWLSPSGEGYVTYADRKYDDTYDYKVMYAVLPKP